MYSGFGIFFNFVSPSSFTGRYTRSLGRRNFGGAQSFGTELNLVHEGVLAAMPLEMCYRGWQESLAQLAKLVEPEIADYRGHAYPSYVRTQMHISQEGK